MRFQLNDLASTLSRLDEVDFFFFIQMDHQVLLYIYSLLPVLVKDGRCSYF